MTNSDVSGGCPLHDNAVPLYGQVVDRRTWAELRARYGTLAPVELEPGVAAWLVLGYHECVEVMRDTTIFSRDSRGWREITEGRMKPDSPLMSLFGERPWLLRREGLEHQRLRSTIVDALARLTDQRLQSDIRVVADQLIDRFVADGQADLLNQYARWLPILVVNRAFGMDDRHGHLLMELSRTLLDADPAVAEQAQAQLLEYFVALIAIKRERPGPDLPSWLLEHPAGLTDDELVQQLAQLLLGNSEPTAHLLSNTLLALLADRTFWNRYARSELQVEEAVNRVLWQDPPLPVLAARYARTDTRIGDTTVRAGEGLLLGLGAAHTDPVLGDAVEVAESSYANRAHLAWGAGPHRCPAERLARQIAQIGIGQLLQRIPAMRLTVPADELTWLPVMFLRGLAELPVEFPPGEPLRPSVLAAETLPAPATEPASARPWFARLASWLGARQK